MAASSEVLNATGVDYGTLGGPRFSTGVVGTDAEHRTLPSQGEIRIGSRTIIRELSVLQRGTGDRDTTVGDKPSTRAAAANPPSATTFSNTCIDKSLSMVFTCPWGQSNPKVLLPQSAVRPIFRILWNWQDPLETPLESATMYCGIGPRQLKPFSRYFRVSVKFPTRFFR